MFIPETGKARLVSSAISGFLAATRHFHSCGDNGVRTLIQPEKIRLVAPALFFVSLLLLPTGSFPIIPTFLFRKLGE